MAKGTEPRSFVKRGGTNDRDLSDKTLRRLARIGKEFAAQPFDETPWLAIGDGMRARLEEDEEDKEQHMAKIALLFQSIRPVPAGEQRSANAKGSWLKTGLPPDWWHKTPLCGLLKDIERWAGTTDKTLHNKNGVRWWVTPWIGTDDPKAETRYAIYFPTEAQYATANQRRLAPASKNTKSTVENRRKSERTGAVRIKTKRK